MSRNRSQTWLLTALFAGLTVSGLALAAKPGGGSGGGGDPGPVPPGTIYFQQSSTDSGSSFASMLADGSGKTQKFFGEPSDHLHGGERWFLDVLPTAAEDEFGNAIEQLFVISERGQMWQLTNDPNVSLWAGYVIPRWSADDSSLSFQAFNAENDPDAWQEALFVADVDWSTNSPLIDTPRRILESGTDEPSIGFYDWSPAGDEIVHGEGSGDYAVKITRFLPDATTETRELGIGMWLPAWSPDGSRIAFGSLLDGVIWTIRPDGTDAVKVSNPGSGQWHHDQVWSPDSQHLAFTQETTTKKKSRGGFVTTYTVDILRISAAGGTTTNLTGDTDAACYPWAWR